MALALQRKQYLPLKTTFFIPSCAIVLCLILLGLKAPGALLAEQYCSQRFHYCLDYPASMFSQPYLSADEESLVLTTLDTLGRLSVISTATARKLDSHQVFEERLRTLSDANGQANILSITNGDDYYEVSFLCGSRWYYQKAGFFSNYDVLFTIEVPVNRTQLMMRMKEDVSIEF